MTATLAHRAGPAADRRVPAVDMGRAWLHSRWAEVLPDEATWIYLLAVAERMNDRSSLRDAVGQIDPTAVRWLDQPLTTSGPLRADETSLTSVDELALLMEDLGLLRTGTDGWRPTWPLPSPPVNS